MNLIHLISSKFLDSIYNTSSDNAPNSHVPKKKTHRYIKSRGKKPKIQTKEPQEKEQDNNPKPVIAAPVENDNSHDSNDPQVNHQEYASSKIEPSDTRKQKGKKKPKRRSSKAHKPDLDSAENIGNGENQNIIESSKVINKPEYFSFSFKDDKYVNLNLSEPRWTSQKAVMEQVLESLNSLKSLCQIDHFHLFEVQNLWEDTCSKLHNDIHNHLIEQNRLARNSLNTYASFNNEHLKNELNTETNNSGNLDNNDDQNEAQNYIKSESTPNSKAINENRRAVCRVLGYAKEELQKLEETFSKRLENAREDYKKTKFQKRYMDFRNRLGLNQDIAPNSINITNLSLPIEINSFLFSPMNSVRKIQNLFTVDISSHQPQDRSSQKQCNLVLTGLSEDVQNCIEFLKKVDPSESQTIQLDSAKIGYLIGRGGSRIRNLENDFKVLINISNENATLYGTPQNILSLKAHLEEILSKQIKEQFHYKSINMNSKLFHTLSKLHSSRVRKIGEETNTNITMINLENQGRLGIKGKNSDEIEIAFQRLIELQNEIASLDLIIDDEVLKKLQNTSEFIALTNNKENKELIVVNNNGELNLSGKVEVVNEMKNKISNLVTILKTVPVVVKLHLAQWNLFNQKYQNMKELESFIIIVDKVDDLCTIEFYGDADKLDIKNEVDQFIEENAHLESIAIDKSLLKIIYDNNKTIKQLENTYDLTIQKPNQNRNLLIIIGSPSNVTIAKDSIEKLIAAGNIITDSIPIDLHELRTLKGPGRSTITKLQRESGIKNISIDDTNSIVRLRGNKEAINSAKQAIQDVLARYQRSMRKIPKQSVTYNSNSDVNGLDLSTTPTSSSIPSYQQVDLSNHESFPSLQDSMTKLSL